MTAVQHGVGRLELAAQLRKLRQYQGLSDVTRIETKAPLLLKLAQHALALEGDAQGPVVPRAVDLLRDAVSLLPGESRKLASRSFNFEGDAGSLSQRLRNYADDAGLLEVGSLVDVEAKLVQAVADFVLQEVSLVQARATHRRMAEGGERGAAAALIADQFRAYYRIFSAMSGLSADVEAYLIRRSKGADPTISKYLYSALWAWARWEVSVWDFIADQGGNWIASSEVSENTLADAEYAGRVLLPFSEADASAVRQSLRMTDGELGTFRSALGVKQETVLVMQLKKWVESCVCRNLRRPRKDCEPHRLIAYVDTYISTLDSEWRHMSGWYHLPEALTSMQGNPSRDYFFAAMPDSYELS